MANHQTKDEFADFFDWKTIVEKDAFLTDIRDFKTKSWLNFVTIPEQFFKFPLTPMGGLSTQTETFRHTFL